MVEGLVSVVTPAYNCSDFIRETIASVQAQTYQNWEMVIVDDCSTDNTKEVIEDCIKEDPRIRYFCLDKNSGAAVARTVAMKEARGEYIAFLDSDDLWLPEKLERQLKFMRDNDYAFASTSYEHVDDQGVPMGVVKKSTEKVDYNRMLLDCPVGNSTMMYSVKKMGKFEVPNIRKRNDYALWLRMLKTEKYVWGMPEVLTQYRIRPNSISSNKFKLVKYHWKLYREIEHLSVVRSAFHVGYFAVLKIFKLK